MVNWSTMWTAEKSLEPRDQSLKPLNECCSLRIFSVGIPSHLAQRQQNDERKSTKRCRWVLYYAMTCVSSNILRSINIIDWNYDTSQVFPTLKHPCSIWTHRINASNEYFISIDKLKNKTLTDFMQMNAYTIESVFFASIPVHAVEMSHICISERWVECMRTFFTAVMCIQVRQVRRDFIWHRICIRCTRMWLYIYSHMSSK